MFTCPNDHTHLARIPTPHGLTWVCATCGGRAVSVAVLRKTAIGPPITRLWLAARNRAGRRGRPCPVCGRPMEEVAGEAGGPPLDVCPSCHFVWFDAKEYELLPPLPAVAAEPELPPQAREILAVEQVRALREEAAQQGGAAVPDQWWKFVPGLLGMPVEYADQAVHVTPWATWTVAAVMFAASLLAFRNLSQAVADFGLIPATPGRDGGITLLTSFFIHGGWLHLLGNLYFLVLFGDNVEEYLGAGRYLIVLFAAAILGDVAHIALDPRSSVPVIGASGGISGLIAFYILRFPQARLGLLIRPMFLFRWIQLRAYVFGLIWVALQILGAWQQIAGTGDISALAHLGGAAAGLWFWAVWRSRT